MSLDLKIKKKKWTNLEDLSNVTKAEKVAKMSIKNRCVWLWSLFWTHIHKTSSRPWTYEKPSWVSLKFPPTSNLGLEWDLHIQSARAYVE